MTYKNDMHNCRVCGHYHEDPPWGEYGDAPTYFICRCCGVEFGYEDSSDGAIKAYMERWKRGEAIGARVTYEDWLAKKEQQAKRNDRNA